MAAVLKWVVSKLTRCHFRTYDVRPRSLENAKTFGIVISSRTCSVTRNMCRCTCWWYRFSCYITCQWNFPPYCPMHWKFRMVQDLYLVPNAIFIYSIEFLFERTLCLLFSRWARWGCQMRLSDTSTTQHKSSSSVASWSLSWSAASSSKVPILLYSWLSVARTYCSAPWKFEISGQTTWISL